jgi:hypothetical protein
MSVHKMWAKEHKIDCTGVARVIDQNAPLWAELESVASELTRQAVAAGRHDLAQQGRAMQQQAKQALQQQRLPYVICRDLPAAYIKFLESAR